MKHPRILILTVNYYPIVGGVEVHVRRLARYLKKQGYEIYILTRAVKRKSVRHDAVDGIPVHRIRPFGERAGAKKWIMIPFALFTIIGLRKSFDIIYCPGYRGIGIAAILVGKILRRPVILRAGNIGVLSCSNWNPLLKKIKLSPKSFLATLIKWPIHKTYAQADAFVCISHEIEKEALDCKISPEKIYYLPNGVDLNKFQVPFVAEKYQIRMEEGWPENCNLCIYVGRLSIEKGTLDLVHAWQYIKNNHSKLIIIGPEMPGHYMNVEPELNKFIKEHDMNEKVVVYGASENTPRLLKAADIFIQPSHYEAFGMSVIEAMATGLPIIATNVGGMTDYLIDNVNAVLCNPSSPRDLATKICLLLKNKNIRIKLGERARATVEQKFDESKIFCKFIQIFGGIHKNYSVGRKIPNMVKCWR